MVNFKYFYLSLCVMFGIFGVVPSAESVSKLHKPTVAVTNYPLKYFAERIGGEHIEVVFPIPPDIDPAFWKPDPVGVLIYQAADLILLNGAHYSKWLDKVSLPKRKLVNTSKSFQDRYLQVQDFTTHRHGPQGEHAHTGLAFTTWLDFQQAIQQAEVILKALGTLHPRHEKSFEANFSGLQHDLQNLDQRLHMMVADKIDRQLLASHPVYGYLARRYQLNIRSVLWEPEDIPTATQWTEFKNILSDHPAKWMLWEGEPHTKTVSQLEALGVQSIVFDSTGNVPKQGDFLTIMRQNVEYLNQAFQ